MTLDDFHLLGNWAEGGPEIAIILMTDPLGRVALQLRDDFEHVIYGGYWALFGGHVDPGETVFDAAPRELFEETGLVATSAELKPFCRLRTVLNHNHFVFLLNRPVTQAEIQLGEGAGFAFITADQMEQFRLVPAARDVLDHYFAQT